MRHPCRCRRCGSRKSLRRHPDDYLRHRKCSCGGSYRVDWFRKNKEFKNKVCYCDGLHYPHRPASVPACKESYYANYDKTLASLQGATHTWCEADAAPF